MLSNKAVMPRVRRCEIRENAYPHRANVNRRSEADSEPFRPKEAEKREGVSSGGNNKQWKGNYGDAEEHHF